MTLYKNLWPMPRSIEPGEMFASHEAFSVIGDISEIMSVELNNCFISDKIKNDSDVKISFKLINASELGKEGYRLQVKKDGIRISANQQNGLYYGLQTLLQLFCEWRRIGSWQELDIEDSPVYAKRSFMADMGRSIFTIPMLKRIIRILAKLKMNQLHLHMLDDELCGIRFAGHKFGYDNPYAITIEQLGELIQYARQYYVEIVPEIEGWAHVGSITYHRPELRGGDGVYNGSSFLVSRESFELMRDLIEQIAEVMPEEGTIHLGLDEAKWFVADNMPEDYSPEQMFIQYYQIIQEINKLLNKKLTMRMWHDHHGRSIPKEIKEKIIVEPWNYWNQGTQDIERKIAYFSHAGMRWIIGAGQSMGQYRGAYHATRHWCRKAVNSPDLEGVNITFWGRNDLENHLISLFAGAYFAWNPLSEADFVEIEDYEAFDRIVFPLMRQWQSTFREAFPDDLLADRGPCVYNGFYWGGDNHGRPISPCAEKAGTTQQHDFINETSASKKPL